MVDHPSTTTRLGSVRIALTASGSVITENVPAEALALGRAKQVNKPGLATALRARLKAIKAAKGKS